MKKPANPTTPRQQKPDPHADTSDGESAVLATIAAMPEPDRVIAGRLHAIIKASAPVLSPRLWYGMPAYAKDGRVVCFFQGMEKFKTRYATFGFRAEKGPGCQVRPHGRSMPGCSPDQGKLPGQTWRVLRNTCGAGTDQPPW